MPVLPPKYLASPFLGGRPFQGIGTSLLSMPTKQRGRQRDIDFALPAATRSLAAGRLPPQDFQQHRPSCGIPTATTTPAGVFPDKP